MDGMRVAELPAVEQFIRNELAIATMRPPQWSDYAAYEAAKRDFWHRHPEATPGQYERAIAALTARYGI